MGAEIVTLQPFTLHIGLMCGATFLLLLVSALISGAETAFFTLNHNHIKQMKESDDSGSKLVIQLLGKIDLLLATVLIANNLVNICIVVLSAHIIDGLFIFHRFEFLFKTVIVTFLLLLFGEILPKVFAQTIPLQFAKLVARPIMFFRTIFYPISTLLIKASNKIKAKTAHKHEISLDELADAVDMTNHASHEERRMLSGIINFVNTEVEEIMKPRVDMVAISTDEKYTEVKKRFSDSGFSRIPVYEEIIDTIKGVLYAKDLIPHIGQGDDFDWRGLVRKAYFIPEHKKINDLLEEFQSNKVHIAIVVDEYGATLGLVSLEDILEEIVGEISDESDKSDSPEYTKVNKNTYIFDAKTHIIDFERIIDIPEDSLSEAKGDAETLAGLVLELKRELPKKGDSVMVHNLKLTVLSLNGRRIDKLKVLIND